MKLKKIAVSILLASTIISGLSAENNTSTDKSKIAAKEIKVPPVVGGSLVDITTTTVFTTGYRASRLLNEDIYNEKGEKIGKVDDLIVGGNGNVTFAVLSVGGFLGINARLVAVPAILFDTNDKGQFMLRHASKEELKSLPAFNYVK